VKWCCEAFHGHYQMAGQRGLGLLVERNASGVSEFVLQFRAVEGDRPRLSHTEQPLSLVEETQIRYCPWCGRQLDRWYGNKVDQLRRPNLRLANLQDGGS